VTEPREPGDTNLSRTYIRVLAVEAIVLGLLFAFSRYFS
jgi:hypothetical protein